MAVRSYTLNKKEVVVFAALPVPEADAKMGELMTLEEIAKAAFGAQKRGSASDTKGNSWVRNSMRKLLALGLVKHGPGNKSGRYARTRMTLGELASMEAERKAKKEEKTMKVKAA